MFGFLNVYKPKGKTSHDVVATLRRVTKIKQIGHTGTLDPFAEGVLPICIGNATRLIEYLEDDKAYIGTIKLGEATDTYDIEGRTTKTSDKIVSLTEIEDVLKIFEGEIEQTPPIYSAIKINGKKLYEYARNGEKIEIKPRKVFIDNIHVVNYNNKDRTIEIYVSCSKGTYIRSIANDIGEALGSYGHLVKLVRIKAGKFELKDSIKLEELETKEKIEAWLQNPLKFLNLPEYELNTEELKKIANGNSIDIKLDDGMAILTFNKEIAAIGMINKNIFKCKKVFVPPKAEHQ
ncbi:tRNA pseudouridine(55) synthase TruB [bacterium]|nr:tRNA pseudouridine(55) synthase TruB [bacterium]MBR1776424.1 tRNA pseudouridine(55) synthase TruB [bacterium]